MDEHVLSGRQLTCITALYIIGSSSFIGSSGIAGKDTWLALLLAGVLCVPLVLLYARISTLYASKNLFDIIYQVFGEELGWAVTLVATAYCFGLGTMVLRDFPEFAHTTSLLNTPKLILALLLGLTCAYLTRLGAGALGKSGILFSTAVALVALVILLLLAPNMDLRNLQPVLADGWKPVALGAAKFIGAPFGETVLLLCVFCNQKADQKKRKPFLLGLLLGGAYLAVSVLRNILTLGAGNFSSLYYPSYSAVGTIEIGEFFQRIEVVVACYLLLCDIIKIAVAMYAACLGLSKLLRVADYRKLVTAVSLLMIACSMLPFQSTMQFFSWSPAFLSVSAVFSLGLPVIFWTYGEIKRKSAEKAEKKPPR